MTSEFHIDERAICEVCGYEFALSGREFQHYLLYGEAICEDCKKDKDLEE